MLTITSIATVVLVILTGYYAWQNRKYVKLVEEERKRGQIQAITDSVLYPLLIKLRENSKKLSEGGFIKSISYNGRRPRISLGDTDISKFFEKNEYDLYKFLIPKNYRLQIERLKEKYLDSVKNLKSQISNFIEITKDKLPTEFDYELLKLIIEDGEGVKLSDNQKKFWELNRHKIESELLRDKEIKDKIKEIKKNYQEILEIVKNCEKIVEELIDKWIKDYGLLLYPKNYSRKEKVYNKEGV